MKNFICNQMESIKFSRILLIKSVQEFQGKIELICPQRFNLDIINSL
jgi:hypothetical protein